MESTAVMVFSCVSVFYLYYIALKYTYKKTYKEE